MADGARFLPALPDQETEKGNALIENIKKSIKVVADSLKGASDFEKAMFGKVVVDFEKVWDPTKVPHKVVDGVFQDKPSPQSLWKAFLLDAFKNPDTPVVLSPSIFLKKRPCVLLCYRVALRLQRNWILLKIQTQ